MTFQQFTAFGVVAKCKNITKAAHELRTSQPSVSKHIKTLEDTYQLKLFRRNGKGVELTDDGIEFLELVQPIINQFQAIERRYLTRAVPRNPTTSLRLGGSYTASSTILPPVIKAFNRRYPGIELILRTSDGPTLGHLLVKGQLDLGLSSVAPQIPEVVVEYCMPLKLIAFAAKGYAVPIHKNKISIEEVPLIIRDAATQNGPTKRLLRCLRTQGYKPNIVLRCDSPGAIKMAASRKLGVGILYEDILKEDIARGSFKRVCIPGLPLEGSLYVLYYKERPLPESAEGFLSLLRQWCNNQQPYQEKWANH